MVARNRVILSGTLFGSETWSVGLNYGPIGDLTGVIDEQSDLNDWAGELANNLPALVTPSFENMLSIQANVSSIQTQVFTADNILLRQSPEVPVVWVGTGAAARPPQCAQVVSLLTAQPGKSYRGRMYLPSIGNTVTGAGKFPATASLLTDVKLILNEIEAAASSFGSLRLQVYSPTLNILTPVNALRIGDVIDTQRRRRDALVETYVSSGFPA